MHLNSEQTKANLYNLQPCSFLKRCGAMLYDFILLVCVVFIAWQPVPLLPESLSPPVGRGIRLGYLLAICFGYFGWSWCRSGQTLGMRAWKVQLVVSSNEYQPVTWQHAWRRFLASILSWATLGTGFMFALFHADKLAWNDMLSGTRLIIKRQD